MNDFMLTKVASVIALSVLLTIHTAEGRSWFGSDAADNHQFNDWYKGEYNNRLAFPVGGIGAGMFCVEGTGAISHMSVRNRMEVFFEPLMFAAVCVKGEEGNIAKVLEGPVPDWKIFGPGGTGNGKGFTSYGLPHFAKSQFLARFPFGTVKLADKTMPFDVELVAWSPFIPTDADNSSLPVGAIEYTFKNTSRRTVEAVFSYNAGHFLTPDRTGDITTTANGFVLSQQGKEGHPEWQTDFAILTDGDEAVVDHCWFRGDWFDSLTLAWENIAKARLMANGPIKGFAPGASLFVPFELKPGQTKTIRLLMAWYSPNSTLEFWTAPADSGPAFDNNPIRGTAPGQQTVSGFLGDRLINTFASGGDAAVGKLTSAKFTIRKDYIHFLLSGGDHPGQTCMNLIVNNRIVRTQTGRSSEALEWYAWDVPELKGQKAHLEIVDDHSGIWGHVNVDHIVFADSPNITPNEQKSIVFDDFEDGDLDGWVADGQATKEETPKKCCPNECGSRTHRPWYTGKFKDIHAVIDYWKRNYAQLRRDSDNFRDVFYGMTLPAEVIEAVAANLTILKSPTCLRQPDGRLYVFEGCNDDIGCCPGSCTHVWNYAQAFCHLFPSLERTLRETEFFVSQDETGHQMIRTPLPISKPVHNFYSAADGQLGGIMKVYRDWRIAGDDGWLKKMWPKVKEGLDYCQRTWDPRERGAIEESHHNTYDINYWGPNGHCTSFYLGALNAAIRMGTYLGEDVSRYQALLDKGIAFMEDKLYDGEYFIQRITTEGLNEAFKQIDYSNNGAGYRDIISKINVEGPKYQYGTGCLSDGVLGSWMETVCGLEPVLDPEKVISHLKAVYKYNLRHDLSDHANPQRPTYARGTEGGLLLCTWPKGGELSLPFVYSNEVWTGIEYQAASHMILKGMIEEGLDIVRTCRKRYDGRVRNPFNEYECGHWYGRALSSYGLLQALTGVRYDAVENTLYIDSKVGRNFKSFLSTDTGFGLAGLKNGKPFIEVAYGSIDVDRFNVSGKMINR